METALSQDIPYFIPDNPLSNLAKLQRRGFFLRTKSETYRDFILIFVGLLFIFYISFKEADNVDFMGRTIITLVVSSLIYAVGFLFWSGAVTRVLAILFTVFFLAFISGVFPPFAILLFIFIVWLIIRRVISFLGLLCWVCVSFAFYFLLLSTSSPSNYWPIYFVFAAAISLWCSASYSLPSSLFRIALMFGAAPVILYLILHADSDAGECFDITNGSASIDSSGLRIDFPDSSYLRWVESDVVSSHWRYYT